MGILSSLLGIGQSAPTPVAPQTITETQLAKEVAPFMKDLLEKGQALYKQRIDEGYIPFEGETLAELTPEQLEARTGLKGLVGTQAPAFEEATGLTRGVADKMTPTALTEYMSPYQQAVTDVEKAEAQRTYERDVLPKVRQAQIGAGAFGGTRGTMLESQSLADQQKLISDIQTRGSQQAYKSAVSQFEAQKAREGATGQALANLAPAAFKARTGEYGLLEQIGKEDQTRSQQALDEAYRQYLEERVQPEKTLAQYQSVIAGFPSEKVTRTVKTEPQQPQQSGLGSLLSGALNVGNIYGTFGGFSPGGFGSAYTPMGRKEGGPVLYRQGGGGTGVQPQYLPTPVPQYGGRGLPSPPIRQNIPTIADIPTGVEAGLPAIIPEQPLPPEADLNVANQTALASGQPEFTHQGIRYASNPAGPIPIGESEEQIIGGPGATIMPTLGGPAVIPSGEIPIDLPTQPQVVQQLGRSPDVDQPTLFQLGQMLPPPEQALATPVQPQMVEYTPPFYGGMAIPPGGNQPIMVPADEQGNPIPPTALRPAASGGLVGLPVVKAGMGTWLGMPEYVEDPKDIRPVGQLVQGFKDITTIPGRYLFSGYGLPESDAPAGFSLKNLLRSIGESRGEREERLQPEEDTTVTQVQPTVYTPPQAEPLEPLDLTTLTAEDLEKLSLTDRGKGITSLLYKTILERERTRQEGKAQTDIDIAAAEEAEERYRGSLKSRAIGDMMGAMARGMEKGAGQGFGREVLSGLAEAAAKSSELGHADVEALEAKDKELRKIKKDATEEWSKGNVEAAVSMLEVYDKEIANIIALKESYLKIAEDKTTILTQLATLYRDGESNIANAQAKIWFDAGTISAQDIIDITGKDNAPPFLGGTQSGDVTLTGTV
jgi:hypothetical protein